MATSEWAQSHSPSLNKDTVQNLDFLKSSQILQHRSQKRNFSKVWRSHIILRSWIVPTQQRASMGDRDTSDRQLRPPGCSANICCIEWHGKRESGVLSTALPPSCLSQWQRLVPGKGNLNQFLNNTAPKYKPNTSCGPPPKHSNLLQAQRETGPY